MSSFAASFLELKMFHSKKRAFKVHLKQNTLRTEINTILEL